MSAHTPIVALHLMLLFAILLVTVLTRRKSIGRIFWWIGFGSAALFSAGIAGLLVLLALSPAGFIHPLAFAGGYVLAVIAYGAVAGVFWMFKPATLRMDLPHGMLAVLGIVTLTATWYSAPQLLSRSLMVRIASHDGVPISNAQVSFKFQGRDKNEVLRSDAEGRVAIPLPFMATLEAKIAAEGFAGHSLYLAPNKRTFGAGLNVIQIIETRFLGDLPSVGGMFLYSTPMVASPQVDVYLQRVGEGFLMPYRPIEDLSNQLREAQEIAAKNGSNYPLILSSGDVFNPEMKAQSPEAYGQFKALADIYDPKGPLCHHASNYWSYFLSDNKEYAAQLERIVAMPDEDVKAANVAILAALLSEDVRSMPADDAVAAIRQRLDDDQRLLEGMAAVSSRR